MSNSGDVLFEKELIGHLIISHQSSSSATGGASNHHRMLPNWSNGAKRKTKLLLPSWNETEKHSNSDSEDCLFESGNRTVNCLFQTTPAHVPLVAPRFTLLHNWSNFVERNIKIQFIKLNQYFKKTNPVPLCAEPAGLPPRLSSPTAKGKGRWKGVSTSSGFAVVRPPR